VKSPCARQFLPPLRGSVCLRVITDLRDLKDRGIDRSESIGTGKLCGSTKRVRRVRVSECRMQRKSRKLYVINIDRRLNTSLTPRDREYRKVGSRFSRGVTFSSHTALFETFQSSLDLARDPALESWLAPDRHPFTTNRVSILSSPDATRDPPRSRRLRDEKKKTCRYARHSRGESFSWRIRVYALKTF